MPGEIRYAIRGFLRSPAYTLVAVFSLALGLGANTAIFTLIDAVMLRPLPVREPNSLIIFTQVTRGRDPSPLVSPKMYEQIRDKNDVLEGFAAFTNPPMTLSVNGSAEHVNGQAVSANYFETLGVAALIGRTLASQDDLTPGGLQACVISYGLWVRRFGGDVGAVGRQIRINGSPFTVAGVTPKEFVPFNQGVTVDVTALLNAAGLAHYNVLRTFGRRKPGVSLKQAQAALDVLYHQIQGRPPSKQNAFDTKIILQPGANGVSDH